MSKKAEVNQLDLLLGIDDKELGLPKMAVEIKRLSEKAGEKIEWDITAIDNPTFELIQEDCEKTINGKNGRQTKDLDVEKMKLHVVLAGVVNPKLKDKKLMDKFKVATPIDVIRKILLPGEMSKIYEEISNLSGFGDSGVEEVKN